MCLMLSDTREEGKYSTDLFRFPDLAQRLSDHRTHGASNRHGAYWPQARQFLFVVIRSYFVPFHFALFSPLFQPDPVWSNYSNAPFRQQLYTTSCAFLVLHSPVPCLIFTVSMRGTKGGGTDAWIGRLYWRTSLDQSTKHSSCVMNT